MDKQMKKKIVAARCEESINDAVGVVNLNLTIIVLNEHIPVSYNMYSN